MEEDRRAAAAIALSQLGGHGAVGAESDADNYISVDDYDIDDVNVNLNDDNENSDGDHKNEEMPPLHKTAAEKKLNINLIYL